MNKLSDRIRKTCFGKDCTEKNKRTYCVKESLQAQLLKSVYQNDQTGIMIKIIIVITASDKRERKDVEDTYFCEMSDNKFYKSIIINCCQAA